MDKEKFQILCRILACLLGAITMHIANRDTTAIEYVKRGQVMLEMFISDDHVISKNN
jgi:hypothetical protein